MYSDGLGWKTWMNDFRFGTMVFLPSGEVLETVNRLRAEYDPISAKTCPAHVTITQPFTSAPDSIQLSKIEVLLSSSQGFQVQIGPATTSPNKRLIWLDVNPKDQFLKLREQLHEVGLFRMDLPFTMDFIPHMTISEAQREPTDVESINKQLNSRHRPRNIEFDSVSWIIPDDVFVFKQHRVFRLNGN